MRSFALFLVFCLTASLFSEKSNFPLPLQVKYSAGLNLENFSIIDLKLDQARVFSEVHPLLPQTRKTDLKECSTYFKEEEVFKKALQCANDRVFSKAPYNKILELDKLPNCVIVGKGSPDVYHDSEWDFFFTPLNDILLPEVVGLYEDSNKTIYLVDNGQDITPDIMIHELMHYFLDIYIGDGNAAHDNPLFQTCAQPHFDPSLYRNKKQLF